MSYHDCCRLCLGKSKEMSIIDSVITVAGNNIRLSDILFNFYNYKITAEDPIYPDHICINCVHHLTLTQSFKSLIETSAKTLADSMNLLEYDNEYDYLYDLDTESKPDVDDIDTPQEKSKSKKNKLPKSPIILTKTKLSVNGKPIYCVECKFKCRSLITLSEHCTNNHPVKNTTGRNCDFCNEKFEDFRDLVIHRKLHVNPYLCLTCWDGFQLEEEYKLHKCQPNQNRDKKSHGRVYQQCDQCGKSYPAGYIKIHMATHGDDLKYSCKYCPKKFKVANSLNSHVLWIHKRTRNHKCDACGATFISASAKSTHVRKNHLKEKKYGCESCTKRFFSKSELQRHMLTHTGVKNFHCHLCEKSYQTRHGLNVHLKSHSHITATAHDMPTDVLGL